MRHVQARYITALLDDQAATLRQQDAIVRKSRFAGSASGRDQSAEQAKRPARVGRYGKMSCAVGGRVRARVGPHISAMTSDRKLGARILPRDPTIHSPGL